jgi:hypothetical protein
MSTLTAGNVTVSCSLSADTTGNLVFQSGGNVTAMTIDSSQNVGIGTSSPSSFNGSANRLVVGNGGQNQGLTIYSSPTAYGGIHFADGTSGTDSFRGIVYYNHSDDSMQFWTSATERARFTSSGDFSVNGGGGGKVGISTGNAVGLRVDTTTANESIIVSGSLSNLQVRHPAAGLELINTGGNAFRIVANTNGVSLAVNGTSWAAISDERRKDIIEPITDAAQKVSTLRAVIGKYDTDEPNTRRAFLIAQDVQAVLPEAVCIGDGESDTLMLAYTDTIPLLVAAIQEQQQMIETLQAKVAALEAA